MRRALVVDDNESNLRLTCAVLEADGWEVQTAMDADGATEAARRLGPRGTDVILLDIQMPGKTGLEVLPEIQELMPQVPVVALTAYAMTGDRERFLEAGFAGYLPKPIDVAEFSRKVGTFLPAAQTADAADRRA